MTELKLRPPSTLARPEAKLVQRFHVGMVGDHTIRNYLEQGWSLGIFCKNCPRTIEWTPPDLLERFGDKLDLKIAKLVPRLACTGDEGCGSKEVAVGPHLYDGEWTWPPKPA